MISHQVYIVNLFIIAAEMIVRISITILYQKLFDNPTKMTVYHQNNQTLAHKQSRTHLLQICLAHQTNQKQLLKILCYNCTKQLIVVILLSDFGNSSKLKLKKI